MGKKYIDIVKYVVESDFEIDGNVEKPDIIGAIFGQTEGLIGADLDLKELQRNGKIGRIEIEFANNHNNKTSGKLFLPSSLGRVETCILGASIESVDRVGPFETYFKVLKVEDTRNEKRKHIIERAKNLIKILLSTEIPDSKEISEMVESDVKISTITTFGPEKFPAGPDVSRNEELILVEGRADVLTLIKNDINNCIAIGGATNNIPDTIVKLTNEKETTLFVDGDRGGEMIMKIMLNATDLDFISRAPDGKEVEELARKEIIKALHSKIPASQMSNRLNRGNQSKRNNTFHQQQNTKSKFTYVDNNHNFNESKNVDSNNQDDNVEKNVTETPIKKHISSSNSDNNIIKSVTEIIGNLHGNKETNIKKQEDQHQDTNLNLNIKNINNEESEQEVEIPLINNDVELQNKTNPEMVNTLKDLQNSLRGRLYDKTNKIIEEIPIRRLLQAMQDTKNINTIVFDGIITQRLIELANKYNIKQLYGLRAQISKKYNNILIYTSENGLV